MRRNVTHTPPDPPVVSPAAGRWYRAWRVLRYVVGLAVGGLAVWAVAGKSDELTGAGAYLSRVEWSWVIAAVAAEAASYLAFAAGQSRLLLAGRVRVPAPALNGITLATTAIQSSLPGGVVLATAYQFRQYRRFGADDILAGWVVVAMGALSFISLAAIAAAGLALAVGTGSALDLVEVILGIAALAGALVVVWFKRRWVARHAARAVALWRRAAHHHTEPPTTMAARWLERIGAISPSLGDWGWAATMALGNWIGDCACLAIAFVAVGAGVPWQGLLLAYGAGQLAITLPITPGGLGVVEGSLTIALVTFGGAHDSTVAAVLLYRIVSFWLLLPVGWGCWGIMSLVGRRARRPGQVVAGTLVADPAVAEALAHPAADGGVP